MNEKSQSQQNSKKRKPRLVLRILIILAVCVIIIGIIGLIVFRDKLNFDSFKRWYSYRSLEIDESGQADAFLYDGNVNDTFAVLGSDLLVCSKNAISVYSGIGTQYVNQSVSLETPVVMTNGSQAVVYDAGGSDLYVLGQREVLWSCNDFDTILSASINQSGMLTVVTQASGYRGAVTVYNSSFEAVMSVRLSSAFVMDAALSDDGKTLAILTIGQQDGGFSSTLSLYTMKSSASATDEASEFNPDFVIDLGSNVILALRHTDSSIWALGDYGLSVTDHSGSSVTVDWSNRYLKLYDLSGDDFAVALLGKYRAGSQASLMVIDNSGSVVGQLDLNEQVLSLSASGRYFAILTGNRLDIYSSNMSLYSSLDGTQGARKVLLMSDGSAILISADSASYFIPN